MLLLSFSLLYSKEAVCIKRGGILLLSLGLKIKFFTLLDHKNYAVARKRLSTMFVVIPL